MEDKTCLLKMSSVFIENISFSRKEVAPNDYSINFNAEYDQLADKSMIIHLTCSALGSDNSTTLKVTVAGHFHVETEDEDFANILLKRNATAILFPYLRSQVSIITCQPGFNPIVIPPMNITELLKV